MSTSITAPPRCHCPARALHGVISLLQAWLRQASDEVRDELAEFAYGPDPDLDRVDDHRADRARRRRAAPRPALRPAPGAAMSHPPASASTIDAELKTLLRRLKLGRLLDTLPERLALARTEHLPHADFLHLVLADEVDRRDRTSAELRARAAKLDPSMRLEAFHTDTGARFDRELWHELCSLRFLDHARGALILGPVGVGKTHLATTLGHIAIRRRHTVAFARADQLFRRLKAARLDNSVEAEMRRLARLDLLVIDDLALQALDGTETADFYELAGT